MFEVLDGQEEVPKNCSVAVFLGKISEMYICTVKRKTHIDDKTSFPKEQVEKFILKST